MKLLCRLRVRCLNKQGCLISNSWNMPHWAAYPSFFSAVCFQIVKEDTCLAELLIPCNFSLRCVFKLPKRLSAAASYPLSSWSCLIKPNPSNECHRHFQRQAWCQWHLRWQNLTAFEWSDYLFDQKEFVCFCSCAKFEFGEFLGIRHCCNYQS